MLRARCPVAADLPGADVRCSTRLDDVAGCNVVLVAAGGCQPVLFPQHVASDHVPPALSVTLWIELPLK